jgi:hypothetical protein
MRTEQIILLIINILGGIAVIGSYVWGLRGSSGGTSVLWGGVPANIRSVYTVSMILSALGYFAFIYFIFFRLIPGETVIGGRFGFSLFFAIFVLIRLLDAAHEYVCEPSRKRYLDCGTHSLSHRGTRFDRPLLGTAQPAN